MWYYTYFFSAEAVFEDQLSGTTTTGIVRCMDRVVTNERLTALTRAILQNRRVERPRLTGLRITSLSALQESKVEEFDPEHGRPYLFS